MLKLQSTEIDEDTVELTYGDAEQLDDASSLLIVRMPFSGTLKRPVMWHQMETLRQAYALIDAELSRVDLELNSF